MSDLARELGLPSPLATRVADELVSRDLVQRVGDQGDRRRVLLRLTAAGSTALTAVHAEAEDLIAAVLERMTAAETESLLLGLHAFLRVLHAPADGAPPALPVHDHAFPTGRPMSHAHAQDGGIVLHRSRTYDLLFGPGTGEATARSCGAPGSAPVTASSTSGPGPATSPWRRRGSSRPTAPPSASTPRQR